MKPKYFHRDITEGFDVSGISTRDLLRALIHRELIRLYSNPTLSTKDIIALEKLGDLYFKSCENDRKEFEIYLKNGIKGDEIDKNMLKEIENLLLRENSKEQRLLK